MLENLLATVFGTKHAREVKKMQPLVAVINDLDLAARWGEVNNRPIYLGEFGAYSKADMDSRVLWTAFVARQIEERGMSWAYWEFCAGFGVYDKSKRVWNEPILKALIPQE